MGNKTKAHDDFEACGAKTRAGTPCKQKAGWGTNHVGTGKCKLHGGKSTGPKDKKKQSKSQKKNNNAEKHGLFTKYLPDETMEIVNSMDALNTINILWDNIKIQYAAIVRSQQIMYVRDSKDDDPPTLDGVVVTANEKQSNYLISQSRAMGTLSKMIKDYEELCRSEIATDTQKARLEQIKAKTENLKGVSSNVEDTSDLRKLLLDESN